MTDTGKVSIELTEWRHGWRDKYPVAVAVYTVSADTKEQCFHDIYDKHERSLRYMNGWCIKLNDHELEKEYREWLKDNLTIDLYYGGGVVD